MRMQTADDRAAEPALDALESVEFELALDMQDPTEQAFETCVSNAAQVVGGEILFDMPADDSIEDATRMAAVRIPGAARDRILFVVLDEAGSTLRIASTDEVGERFHGFARAFVSVLERIRDDLPELRPVGTA
ncbi:hypothetical protein Sa4125_06610 [Aureimonas sp. SA4125]|uniref:hypothetical protein n=1 Tax=Aureimonas sp. SA4125 TaxID=2826993 RepID=UPI001CC820CA|nr:hypothetical protein [Aureimonas sp. SA4125]BDA83119.1 hypothetical protein Sa4125_06610 [Aureimonas sp. SA4125]